MLSTQHTQSLTDFRQKATETLDRLNRTGDAEIITLNGIARAILIAPEVYDELDREAQLNKDVSNMRHAMAQIEAGQGREMNVVFDEIRAKLLAKKGTRIRKSAR
jgi:PHD/YefM family antitoxin component YafN of YafNO toxin-antitoxin module